MGVGKRCTCPGLFRLIIYVLCEARPTDRKLVSLTRAAAFVVWTNHANTLQSE
jgi:hypothetical protein